MGRILALATAIYAYGDACFDGRRPSAFDRPVREFRRSADTLFDSSPSVGRALDRLRGVHLLDNVRRALNRSF